MNFIKQPLNPILEENTELCVELTYFSDTLPSIKSYYIMSPNEYEELKTLYLDIYIENFINGETLTKDKLDVYLINNIENVSKCKTFIEQFGNTFDILSLIHAKKTKSKETKKINICSEIFTTGFSDTDDSNNINSESDSDSLEYTERFIKLKSNKSDDKYINTLTEIIDTYNKSNIVDNKKIKEIAENKPELLKDDILSEIIKNNL